MQSVNELVIIDRHNNKVNVLESLNKNNNSISGIGKSVNDLNESIEIINNRLTSDETNIDSTNTLANKNKDNIATINSDLETLTNGLNTANDEIGTINSELPNLLKNDISNITEDKLLSLNSLNLINFNGVEINFTSDLIDATDDCEILVGLLSDKKGSCVGISLYDSEGTPINAPNIITKLEPKEVNVNKYITTISGTFYSNNDSLEVGTNCYSDINLDKLVGIVCYKVGSIFKINKGYQTFSLDSQSQIIVSSCYKITGDLINGYCPNNQLSPGDIIYEDQLMKNKLYDITSYTPDSSQISVLDSNSDELQDTIQIGSKLDNKEDVFKYNFDLDGFLYSKDSDLIKDSKLYKDENCAALFGIVNSINSNKLDIIPNAGETIKNQSIEVRTDYERVIDSDYNGVIDYSISYEENIPLYVRGFIPKDYKFKVIVKDCNNVPKIYKYLLNKFS